MSGVMASVDQRTQLAGRNRLELLMFRLHGQQLYGINVFKVKEVLPCPKLNVIPNSHQVVRGVATIRGKTISIMDLSLAVGGLPIANIETAFVIISEYNRNVQGFLVREVDRIINLNWKDMLPPPSGAVGNTYLTAVTYVEEKMVEVLDVERVLAEVVGAKEEVSDEVLEGFDIEKQSEKDLILVSDDSSVARRQVCITIEENLKLKTVVTKDGQEALNLLKGWADDNDPRLDRLAMVISDIEMPEMDGYTFTTEVRSDDRLKHLYIILHTSMSGVFNESMVDNVGANKFIPKFEPDILASAVIEALNELS